METKYKISNKDMIINIYNQKYEKKENKINNWLDIINNLIFNNKLKFKGKRILIYENNIYMGYFSLTKFYLKKLYLGEIIHEINNKNCYFYPYLILEFKPKVLKIQEEKLI